MKKFFGSLVLVTACLQLAGCGGIPENVARSLAETTGKGGKVIWTVPASLGATIVAICRPEEMVDIVSVSGSPKEPRIQSLDTDVASCGKRHQLWQKYDNAMTTYKKEAVEKAMTSLQTEMDK